MPVRIPKRVGDRDQPGPWWWPATGDGGKRSASVRCPDCGTIAHLDHSISDSGRVSPSLVCPGDGCSFHVYVSLDDWPPAVSS